MSYFETRRNSAVITCQQSNTVLQFSHVNHYNYYYTFTRKDNIHADTRIKLQPNV